MNHHDVFIAAVQPAPAVRAAIADALGAAFQPSLDPEPVPVLAVGPTKVFFHDSHHFEDDADFPVSRYRYWVNVQDSGHDENRQLEVARRVFDAARTAGWPALLSYAVQRSIAVHP